MKTIYKAKCLAVLLGCVMANWVMANNDYRAELKNQSDPKQGYILVQKYIWSKGCVLEPAANSSIINPGESAVLRIKSSCTWGGVRYDVFKVGSTVSLGSVSQSFRDGTFNIESSAPCKDAVCNFIGIIPQ